MVVEVSGGRWVLIFFLLVADLITTCLHFIDLDLLYNSHKINKIECQLDIPGNNFVTCFKCVYLHKHYFCNKYILQLFVFITRVVVFSY